MRARWLTAGVPLGLGFLWAGAAFACATPKPLIGRWEVEHVNVDMADQMHWGTRPDEPSLLGRALVIEQGSVRFTADEKSKCTQMRWHPLTISWGALFNKGFLRAEAGGRSPHPTPADFGLNVSDKERVKAYLLCSSRKSPRDAWMQDLWIVQQSADTLLMHYDNQVLLVLKRRPADEAPRASFPCDEARSPTEKTICSDVELASWDRSVAAALRQATAGRSSSEIEALVRQQNAWRAQLGRCDTNKKCLDEALWRRVSDLVGH